MKLMADPVTLRSTSKPGAREHPGAKLQLSGWVKRGQGSRGVLGSLEGTQPGVEEREQLHTACPICILRNGSGGRVSGGASTLCTKKKKKKHQKRPQELSSHFCKVCVWGQALPCTPSSVFRSLKIPLQLS